LRRRGRFNEELLGWRREHDSGGFFVEKVPKSAQFGTEVRHNRLISGGFCRAPKQGVCDKTLEIGQRSSTITLFSGGPV
jgi:hypothetical protein